MPIEYKAYAIGPDGRIALRVDLVCEGDESLPKNARVNWLTPIPPSYGRARGSWAGSIRRIKAATVSGDPSRIRTCNPRSRNPLLYPVELWDRSGAVPAPGIRRPIGVPYLALPI